MRNLILSIQGVSSLDWHGILIALGLLDRLIPDHKNLSDIRNSNRTKILVSSTMNCTKSLDYNKNLNRTRILGLTVLRFKLSCY